MSLRTTARHQLLCTAYGTVLYVDDGSGELRHGAIKSSPSNVALARDEPGIGARQSGSLVYLGRGATQPVACSAEGSWSADSAHAGAAGLAPTAFEVVPLEDGSVGLRAGNFYLSAQADGRVSHSARACGAGERFRLADRGTAIDRLAEFAAAGALTILPGPAFTRFHLGCGRHFIPGYLNIDLVKEAETGKIYQAGDKKGAFFLSYDLSNGIPGYDNSLDVIYHCHFLEHLAYRQAIRLLRHAGLRLKPGGRMRVVVPDLELWIENYHRNQTSFFDAYRRQVLGDDLDLYATKGSVFMGMLHNWGHRCGYDFETLEWLLKKSGFTNIRRRLFQESSIPEIAIVEPYTALRGMESLCVECEKP